MKTVINVETPKELFDVIHVENKLYEWLHTSSEFINNCYKAMRHERSTFKIIKLESDMWSKFADICRLFVEYDIESDEFKTYFDLPVTFDITYPPFTGITPEFLLNKLTKLEDWCFYSIDNFLEVKDNLKVNGHSVPAFEDLLGFARELNIEIEQECYNLQNIIKNHAEPMRVKRKKLKMSLESYKRFFENDNPLFLSKVKKL